MGYLSVQCNVGADGSWSLVVGMELGHRAWWNKKATQANVKHIKMEARLWEGKFQLYDSTSLRVNGCIALTLQGTEFHFL